MVVRETNERTCNVHTQDKLTFFHTMAQIHNRNSQRYQIQYWIAPPVLEEYVHPRATMTVAGLELWLLQ